MALIVAPTTGAEAYISAADADAYFAARGNAAWAALADATAKEQALRQGFDYLESHYAWKGTRVSDSQAASWPRDGVYVDGVLVSDATIPQAIARANAELAVRATAGDLLTDQGAQVVRETVGPLTVEYADGARQDTRYAAVDALLAAYVLSSGQIPVVRA